MTPCERLTSKEVQIAVLVWARSDQSRNRQDHRHYGTGHQEPLAQHLRQAGVWSRLELAMYVASHGGSQWPPEPERANLQASAW